MREITTERGEERGLNVEIKGYETDYILLNGSTTLRQTETSITSINEQINKRLGVSFISLINNSTRNIYVYFKPPNYLIYNFLIPPKPNTYYLTISQYPFIFVLDYNQGLQITGNSQTATAELYYSIQYKYF